MPMISFRVSPELHERLHKACADKETTVTDFLRQAVETFVDRLPPRPFGGIQTGPCHTQPLHDVPAVIQPKSRHLDAQPEKGKAAAIKALRARGFDVNGDPVQRPAYGSRLKNR